MFSRCTHIVNSSFPSFFVVAVVLVRYIYIFSFHSTFFVLSHSIYVSSAVSVVAHSGLVHSPRDMGAQRSSWSTTLFALWRRPLHRWRLPNALLFVVILSAGVRIFFYQHVIENKLIISSYGCLVAAAPTTVCIAGRMAKSFSRFFAYFIVLFTLLHVLSCICTL